MFAPFSLEFYINYKVSIEIQGLSAIFKDFQGLEFVTFKDFQGACEPCDSAEKMTLNLSRHNFFSKKTGS